MKKVFLCIVLLFVVVVCFAQPGPPPPDPGEPVPISGIEILIGAGVLLGAKRLLTLRNRNKQI